MGIAAVSRRGAVGVMGAALLVAGCSGDGGGAGATGDPVVFDATPTYAMTDVSPEGSWPAAVLHEDRVFRSEPGVLVVHDADDGEEIARVEPEGEPLFDSVDPTEHYRATPALAEVEGEPTVLVGFAVEAESGATQLDVEIVAVDAATAEVRWRATFPEPAASPVVPQKDAAVGVNGVERGVAVVSVSHDAATQVTFGLSLATREVLWEDEELSAVGIGSGVAAGFGPDTVAGFDVETGEQVWKSDVDPTRIGRAGPWILVTGEDGETRLLGIADGAEVDLDGAVLTEETFCGADDHAAVVVCAEDDSSVVALDAGSGEVLWSDDDWRGELKGMWRGAVYVRHGDSAVALDARTGEVVVDDTGVAPMIVGDRAGLDQRGTDVQLYPVP